MPNHFHGIIVINEYQKFGEGLKGDWEKGLERSRQFYDKNTFLGSIIAYFKYQTTKLINLQINSPGVKFLQRNYYEHIVRNEESLNVLRNYIIENPLRWEIDVLHPNNLTGVW
ncbi:MAG: transposase [Cyanobacteria bacterium P01_H01_bin.35]